MTLPILRALRFHVPGVPVPQGSHKAFVVGKRAIVTDDNRKTRPYKQDVISAATVAKAGHMPDDPNDPDFRRVLFPTGPVAVDVTFVMPRPKGHYGTGRNAAQLKPSAPRYPETKPDADKLARLVGDSLTAAGIWRDDSQVARWSIWKRYVTEEQSPGAVIEVMALTP